MVKAPPRIVFTIDVEEFDTALDHGYELPLDEQIAVSTLGLRGLTERMEAANVRGTLFTTATYALHEPMLIKQLSDRHEIASHGYYHGRFDPKTDLSASREVLEKLTGKTVTGFRKAQMGPVADADLVAAGYGYNSSLHPTWLPGRYNHLDKPRLAFRRSGLLHIPASVTPRLRIPLFWLSLKNFPFGVYKKLCQHTLQTDGQMNLYVHPWEFTDLRAYPRIPAYIRRHSEGPLLDRASELFRFLGNRGEFCTMNELAQRL
jgi:peptidoglycan/xylan/chitin deacetylase (PgdA/CDA1 family)